MPIYRCNKCGFVSEDALTPVNTPAPCGRCGTPSTVYGTVFFVEELIKRLATVTRDLKNLQALQDAATQVFPTLEQVPAQPEQPSSLPQQNGMANSHDQLAQWFAQRQIQAQFDPSNVDTSGFFDEAATELGENYPLFADLLDRIRYSYRKSYTNVNLELAKLSQKDGMAITKFCRSLYQHTFFARYHFQKPEKIARITLQSATTIRQFFEGGWLEWYCLMQGLGILQKNTAPYSYARSIGITFPNEDLHELDVAFLLPGQLPICIECKTGEFRREIEKYQRLHKRLGLPKDRFIICSTDLNDEQARGLTAMYDFSFVSLQGLKPHLEKLL